MAHVGVVFGGRSTEHQVSIRSARTVVEGLREAGHTVTPLGIAADGCWIDAEASAAVIDGATQGDPAGGGAGGAHGAASARFGGRGGVPDRPWHLGRGRHASRGSARCSTSPYVGLRRHRQRPRHGQGARQAPARRGRRAGGGLRGGLAPRASRRTRRRVPPAASGCPCPLFVKPSNGGSSVGVKKVDDPAGLEAAIRFALRFDDVGAGRAGIKGRELECAVLGYREIEASVVGEIVPGNEFYDYADKYLQDTRRLIAPAELADGRLGPPARDRRRGLHRHRRRRPRPGRLPRRGRGRSLRQRAQHPPRLHQHLDVPPALGPDRRAAPRAGGPPGPDRPRAPPRPAAAGRGDQGVPGGAGVGKKPLITPTLFSQPSTHPDGEKREWLVKKNSAFWFMNGSGDSCLLSFSPLSPAGGWRAGREGPGE